MTVWRLVESTDNQIEVSECGRVRRVERPLVYSDGRQGVLPAAELRCTKQKTGYAAVSFGKRRLAVHRLVAEAFLPEPSTVFAYSTVNHKNGNKLDNRAENIEWATYQLNNAHARETDLNVQHGENTNLSKYSDQFIDAVRNVHATYSPKWEQLGRMFGITGCHARQIVLRETRARPTKRRS
jgi:hypothetical protein